ncbi:MAG: hypothetical protein D6781_03240 [Verrucomicrobia bacterium]|nr:MAG: hypothetical protein D6781_03240 [Verrucomicrobiota bacterium]
MNSAALSLELRTESRMLSRGGALTSAAGAMPCATRRGGQAMAGFLPGDSIPGHKTENNN